VEAAPVAGKGRFPKVEAQINPNARLSVSPTIQRLKTTQIYTHVLNRGGLRIPREACH
jgi:hypothetical protein